MSVLDIVLWPDARLTRVCAPVDRITPELVTLIADMFDTMYDAPGRGLAAPQVGRFERIFVFDGGWKGGNPTPIACVNPEIVALSDARLTGEEGWPVDPRRANGHRPRRRGHPALDRSGRNARAAFQWSREAVIVQHEYDHLDGIVIYDRVSKAAPE